MEDAGAREFRFSDIVAESHNPITSGLHITKRQSFEQHSMRMNEIRAVAEVCTILRDGRTVIDREPLAGMSDDAMIEAMGQGRKPGAVSIAAKRPSRGHGPTILSLTHGALSVGLAAGDILGLAGAPDGPAERGGRARDTDVVRGREGQHGRRRHDRQRVGGTPDPTGRGADGQLDDHVELRDDRPAGPHHDGAAHPEPLP